MPVNTTGLLADRVKINNRQKTISATAGHVSFNKIMIDDSTGNIKADGMHWKEAEHKNYAATESKKSVFIYCFIEKYFW
jgi:hypothetical protein